MQMRITLSLVVCATLSAASCQSDNEMDRATHAGRKVHGITMDKDAITPSGLCSKELAETFAGLLKQWERYRNCPRVIASSRLDVIYDCEAYRAVVKLGRPVLPLIIDEMREHNFWLAFAVRDITGVTPAQLEEELGIQGLSVHGWDPAYMASFYIQWWDSKGAH
jgi:hypothetical protein